MAAETEIATLVAVDIKEVWAREATDFTPWLAKQAELLGGALGLELEHEKSEAAVGRYSADLLFREICGDIDADTEKGRVVVVENMFGSTDHDHLGKLITYAAGLEAGYAVLVAEKFREEHRSALNWLNRVSTEDVAFFGVVLEAWRIGDSPPAPRLHVDVKPNDWNRYVRAARASELTPRRQAYHKFWTEFLPALGNAHSGWSGRTPIGDSWMEFRSGSRLCSYHAGFCRAKDRRYRLRVGVYIDSRDETTNKDTFDKLHDHKQEIEQRLGEPLVWGDALHDARASRISLYHPDDMRITDEERWPEAMRWLVEAMGRIRTAFDPAIQGLRTL